MNQWNKFCKRHRCLFLNRLGKAIKSVTLALSSHKRENEILFTGTDAIYHKRNALPLNCRQPSFHPVFASFRSQDHHTLPQYNNSQSSAGNHQALKTRKNYILTKGKPSKRRSCQKKLPPVRQEPKIYYRPRPPVAEYFRQTGTERMLRMTSCQPTTSKKLFDEGINSVANVFRRKLDFWERRENDLFP